MQVNGTSQKEREPVAEDLGSLDATLNALQTDVRRVLKGARRVVRMELQRLHLFAIETFFRTAFYICLLGFALTATISASLFVVRGVRGALLAWSGAEWVGELGAGAVVLGVISIGALTVRAQLRQKLMRRLRRSLLTDAPLDADEPKKSPAECRS
jgi:hypothetical protein